MDRVEYALNRWFARVRADRWARRNSFTEPEFQPYVQAIGQLLLAWNDFHEKLASLFVMAMGGGWVVRPLALWHAVKFDMQKRQLLKTAIEQLPDRELEARPDLKKEIVWILDSAKELEGLRDDAAHTPLAFVQPWSKENGGLGSLLQRAGGVFAESMLQNPRAARIEQKRTDLLAEFEYARNRVIILRDYAMAIDMAWGNERLPWPDRPPLPNPPPRSGPQQRGKRRKSE